MTNHVAWKICLERCKRYHERVEEIVPPLVAWVGRPPSTSTVEHNWAQMDRVHSKLGVANLQDNRLCDLMILVCADLTAPEEEEVFNCACGKWAEVYGSCRTHCHDRPRLDLGKKHHWKNVDRGHTEKALFKKSQHDSSQASITMVGIGETHW